MCLGFDAQGEASAGWVQIRILSYLVSSFLLLALGHRPWVACFILRSDCTCPWLDSSPTPETHTRFARWCRDDILIPSSLTPQEVTMIEQLVMKDDGAQEVDLM